MMSSGVFSLRMAVWILWARLSSVLIDFLALWRSFGGSGKPAFFQLASAFLLTASRHLIFWFHSESLWFSLIIFIGTAAVVAA